MKRVSLLPKYCFISTFRFLRSEVEAFLACEQAPGWVSGEIAECSLGRAGRAESGLVRRECAGGPVDIPLMPPFHDTSSWYQDLIG